MNRSFASLALALTLVLPLAESVARAQAATDPAAQNTVQNQAKPAPNHRMHDPHKMAIKLSRRLNLTPDQTAKVEPVLAERQQKIQAVKANTALTPDQVHQQMHEIGKTTHAELAGVLTPDQMQQMKSMHKSHEPKQNTPPPGA